MSSRNEQRIDNLCMLENLVPKVVYDQIKIFLEHYRSGFGASRLFRFDLNDEGIRRQKVQMRREYLRMIRLPMEEFKEEQDRLFQNLRGFPWMREVIEIVLNEIAVNVEDGNLYKRIIVGYYLKSDGCSNEEMARSENMSTASFERKKREAIKCFGISLYRYAYRREMEDREDNSYVGI